ncbi:hypothetical protein [Streptomyces paromomycinus]|uniref:hypothetical protein n=1 Tax=Streptomyces paromomycinus TaxID=92743 RepID=UPI001C3F9B1F|nr:hypothetical protein [Streptomyces paromomycinus]
MTSAKTVSKSGAADARLRGRATRTPGALSLTHARALRVLTQSGPLSIRELDTALADYDAAALDSAAEVLRRLSGIYDRL